MTHSYFVAMGGFAIEFASQLSGSTNNFFPSTASGKPRMRLTISPDALLYFQENELKDLIPAITRNEIRDKSKGNALANALACLQGNYNSLHSPLFMIYLLIVN